MVGAAEPAIASTFRRLFVKDTKTGEFYLIDTGAAISILPRRKNSHSQCTPTDYQLYAANGTSINTYGTERRRVHLGLRRDMPWTFLITDVSHPILGADFLSYYSLLVDVKGRRLVDDITGFTVQGTNHSVNISTLSCIPSGIKYERLLKQYPNLCNPVAVRELPPSQVEHYIETTGAPVRAKARRLPPDKYQLVKEEFTQMIKEGICRPSKSPWASPLHIVYKKDGTIRPCGDYRQLNGKTLPDRYGVPNLHDFTNQLHGTKIYSALDINKAYHHIPIAQSDIPKTAIITPFGLFEFVRMTFGLRNAAQSFQRYMDNLFRDLPFVFVYIDDILVASKNEEEHEKHLAQVFELLERNRLILNLSKCTLGKPTINFLGYQVSPTGILPLPDRVEAILNFKKPETVKELRRFLGIINFYRKSLPHAAARQKPLNNYLHKSKKNDRTVINWTDDALKAFEETKADLANAVQLAHPSSKTPWYLLCDASDIGIGAVLQQGEGDEAEPLGYFSRALNKAQSSYSTYDRELLAIFEAVKYFRPLLEGREFTILTDHKPLIHSMHQNTSSISPRRIRQLNFIAQFSTNIQYKPGRENQAADALSRIGEISTPDDYQKFVEAQTNDTVLERLTKEGKLTFDKVTIPGTDIKLTCEMTTSQPRPYVPEGLRKSIFQRLHGLSHPGIRTTRKLISQKYFWPSMNKDIGIWARSCIPCQTSKVSRHTNAPLGSFAPAQKFEHVHMDIVGPLPPSNGKMYCLTMIDRNTRWPEAIPLSNITANTVAKMFVRHWVSRFGVPVRLTTDQGRQFESDLFSQLTRMLGITRIRTNPYHPQSNGCVERWHRSLKTALIAQMDTKKWVENLPTVLLGLRTALRRDTNLTCAEALYHQTLRLPGEFFMPSKMSSQDDEIIKALKEAMSTVRKPERRQSFVHPALQKCTHIFLKNDLNKKALEPPYTGPFKVVERATKDMKIQLPGRQVRVSIDRLKPAHLLEDDNDKEAPEAQSQVPQTPEDKPNEPSEHHIPGNDNGYRTRSGRLVKPPVRFS